MSWKKQLLCLLLIWVVLDAVVWAVFDAVEFYGQCRKHGVPFSTVLLFEQRQLDTAASESGQLLIPALSMNLARGENPANPPGTGAFAAAQGSPAASASIEETFHGNLNYRLLEPLHIADGERYPLLVFLHGAGERGRDGISQLKEVPVLLSTAERRRRFPCFLLVPQCPENTHWGSRDGSQPRRDQLELVMLMVRELMRDYPVDAGRVYVMGYSMGGYGTWELICRYPKFFAAAVPIAGGGDPSRAGRLADVPVWAVHGDADTIVPVSLTREMITAMRTAGGRPRYSELQGVGHASWRPALSGSDEILEWMFSQRRRDAKIARSAALQQ